MDKVLYFSPRRDVTFETHYSCHRYVKSANIHRCNNSIGTHRSGVTLHATLILSSFSKDEIRSPKRQNENRGNIVPICRHWWPVFRLLREIFESSASDIASLPLTLVEDEMQRAEENTALRPRRVLRQCPYRKLAGSVDPCRSSKRSLFCSAAALSLSLFLFLLLPKGSAGYLPE